MLESKERKLSDDGQALLRVARELREFLRDAPKSDSDAQALLADCYVLERIGNWLATVAPIQTFEWDSALGAYVGK